LFVVRSYAAGALANLALDEGSRAQMVSDGAVAPLVKLCSKSQDKRVLVRSAARRRSPPPPPPPHSPRPTPAAPTRARLAYAPPSLPPHAPPPRSPPVQGYAALALARLAVSEGSSLADVAGGSALYGLTRAQQSLGRDMPPYLIQVSQRASGQAVSRAALPAIDRKKSDTRAHHSHLSRSTTALTDHPRHPPPPSPSRTRTSTCPAVPCSRLPMLLSRSPRGPRFHEHGAAGLCLGGGSWV
jgi:hypothetical protein